MASLRGHVKKAAKKLFSAGKGQISSHPRLFSIRYANLAALGKKRLGIKTPPAPLAISYDADENEVPPSSSSIDTYECLMYLICRLPDEPDTMKFETESQTRILQ